MPKYNTHTHTHTPSTRNSFLWGVLTSPKSLVFKWRHTQGPTNFSVKVQIVNIFGFVSQMVSVSTTHCAVVVSTEKKCTTWELWVKFYWGQNEDYSLGDSISESSEELLQRGRRKVSVICDFSEGGRAVKHTCWQRLAASHEEQTAPWMIPVLF